MTSSKDKSEYKEFSTTFKGTLEALADILKKECFERASRSTKLGSTKIRCTYIQKDKDFPDNEVVIDYDSSSSSNVIKLEAYLNPDRSNDLLKEMKRYEKLSEKP